MLTVVERAVSGRLAALEDVRLDLDLQASAQSDAKLARLLDQASSRVSTVCNRTFGRQIYRQRLLSSCGGFVLGAGPVNRIVSVGYAGRQPFAQDQYLLADDVLRIGGGGAGMGDGSSYNLWFTQRPELEVVFEAGWLLPGEEVGDTFTGDTPLPADIERAVIQLVGVALSESGRDMTIRTENVQGVGSTTYNAQAPGSMLPHPGAEAALQPYRMLSLV